jgi:tRNA A-37 threonylcarbamoyl transferase component Bud32
MVFPCRGTSVSEVTLPSGFEWARDGRMRFLVRADVGRWLVPLLRAARDGWAGYATQPLAGGRGGARLVRAHGVVVRPYRRGGLPARLLRDAYFGWSPRPFHELCVLAALRVSGAPVVEVYGAAVDWRLPGCYRGWLATRYIEAARTLWEWAVATPPVQERAPLWRAVGMAVRRLHDCGARHPDLNANNILLGPTAGVSFIDFDRAHTSRMHQRGREADLDRLWRSLRKLDPQGQHVTLADFETLTAAYREERACA